MAELPDETWTEILDYLEPKDIVSSQVVSSRLLKLARDSSLWRYKCFEKSPSAAHSQASRSNALSILTGALGGLSLGGQSTTPATPTGNVNSPASKTRVSKRAKAVTEWDRSDQSERIDWYSEYVARNAPLSVQWTESPAAEIRGMAIYGNQEKVVAPLEDGSVCIWDLTIASNGRHKLNKLGSSKSGILFQDLSSTGQSSALTRVRSLGHAVDNISTDSRRARAFAAAGEYLNEVDLETLQVVSQSKFAWPITALSQERTDLDYNLTIGTSWSLHLHDPRVHLGNFTSSMEGTSQVDAAVGDSNIAFFPNHLKGFDGYPKETHLPTMTLQSSSPPPPHFPTPASLLDTANHYSSSSPPWRLSAYARVEPGPQSILHHTADSIIIAGRMPSILLYDRRFFPRLESVIHSGARLSAMTTLPFPPAESNNNPPTATNRSPMRNSTLIAAGEYGGCGSLEIYELAASSSSSPPTDSSPHAKMYKVRNRQEASSSKLLSVASQGTRLVFSDADGNLKWVERDGHGLARRWNINAFRFNASTSSAGPPGETVYTGAEVSGEQVVRKMVALDAVGNRLGGGEIKRGDGDLLVWTGERVGVVSTRAADDGRGDLATAFTAKMRINDEDDGDGDGGRDGGDEERTYVKVMRRALERQADERRWMSRFGGRRW